MRTLKRFGAHKKATKGVKELKEKDFEKVSQAIERGAKIKEEGGYFTKTSYWLYYPQGGAREITKTIFKKLTENN